MRADKQRRRQLLVLLGQSGADLSQDDMVAELGCGAGAVRSALLSLERAGLVEETEPRRWFVTEPGRLAASAYAKRGGS